MFICFTDLDGTLLNHDDYRYDAAVPTLQKLQRAGIPIIINTSKTRAEVVELRQALGLTDPFVVENGSGIFLERNDNRFDLSVSSTVNGFQTVRLGLSYEQAQTALQRLSRDLGALLRGFASMTEAELVEATHLPIADLNRACDREFSEPFVRPANIAVEALEHWAAQNQYQILVGNRFCHMLGVEAGKGKAVHRLRSAFRTAESVTTIGLGDSPNDLSMLEAVDVPIVIPGVNGPHPQLANRGWTIAPTTGCQGWAAAMESVIAGQ
ncbi:MAG: HAD-IIB family hydrolase [Cyanobacteria bacterium P01_F01_bin.42]